MQELELLLIDLAEWVKEDREREGVSQQKKQKRCHNYDPFLHLIQNEKWHFSYYMIKQPLIGPFAEGLCAHEWRHITALHFSLHE